MKQLIFSLLLGISVSYPSFSYEQEQMRKYVDGNGSEFKCSLDPYTMDSPNLLVCIGYYRHLVVAGSATAVAEVESDLIWYRERLSFPMNGMQERMLVLLMGLYTYAVANSTEGCVSEPSGFAREASDFFRIAEIQRATKYLEFANKTRQNLNNEFQKNTYYDSEFLLSSLVEYRISYRDALLGELVQMELTQKLECVQDLVDSYLGVDGVGGIKGKLSFD